MDKKETEELELNSPELSDNEEQTSENESIVNEELNEELENIRDMFQKELNRTEESYEGTDGQVLIQSLEDMNLEVADNSVEAEDDNEDPEDIPEDELCQCCGERRRDTSHGEDYPYCEHCRKLMKRNPFNAVAVLMTVVVLAVAGVALGLMANNVDGYISLLDAEASYRQGKVSTALLNYENYFNTTDSESSYSASALKAYIECYDKMGYPTNAVEIINSYFDEDDLDKITNKSFKEIVERSEGLNATVEYIQTDYYELLSGAKFDYKDTIKKIDKDIKANLEEPKYNQTYLEFLKFIAIISANKPVEDQITQLEQVRKTDIENGGKLTWIYITHLINAYAKAGNVEKAEEYFETAKEVNCQDMSIYNSFANVYRFSLSKKSSKKEISKAADEILEIAEEAAGNFESQMSYPLYFRAYAIGYLLKGDYALAAENIRNYYQNCQSGLTTADMNLSAVISIAYKDDKTLQSIKDQMNYYGLSLSDLVAKYEKGKIDIVSILSDKEAEF